MDNSRHHVTTTATNIIDQQIKIDVWSRELNKIISTEHLKQVKVSQSSWDHETGSGNIACLHTVYIT